MLGVLRGIERTLVWLGLAAGWLLLLPMIAARAYDIVAKQFFTSPSGLIQLIEWDGFFVLVFMIFGLAYLHDAHARIDILRGRFSPRTTAWIEILGIVFAVTPFCILNILYGIDYVEAVYDDREGWWVPYGEGWMKKAFIPLGFGLLLLSAIVVLLRNLIFLKTGVGRPEPRRREDAGPGVPPGVG